MNRPLFITGTGTDVGKTLVAAVVTEALQADYWKPVQAGFADGTDTQTMRGLISNSTTLVHEACYRLATPASPHIAAAKEGITISLDVIGQQLDHIRRQTGSRPLVIEGAGGLLVPLNGHQMVADLVKELDALVLIVSRNYLGSINHSLLTAAYCRHHAIEVAGWVFNDNYMAYENEIAAWSGYPLLGTIPRLEQINRNSIREQAAIMLPALQAAFTG